MRFLSFSVNKALMVIASMFLVAFIFFTSNLDYTSIAVASTILFVLFILFERYSTHTVLTYNVLFVGLLFLFNFGQIIIMGFFPSLSVDQEITITYFPKENVVHGFKWIFLVFSAIICGIAINKKKLPTLESKSNQNNQYLTLSKRLLLLTLPVKIAIDFYFLMLAITSGTGASLDWLYSFPNFIVAFGNLSIIGFAIYVAVSTGRKKNIVTLIVLLYLLLIMASGRRSENVAYFCIILFVYLRTKHTNKKHSLLLWVSLFVLAYLFLTFLYSVVAYRSNDAQDIHELLNTFVTVLTKRNIVIEVLREYGNTGYTALCVTENWLANYSQTFGTSYLFGATSILPNITGIPGKLTEQSNFALQLRDNGMLLSEYRNIGGSLIGELLFNFGFVGSAIAGFVLGCGLSYLENSFEKGLTKGRYLIVGYCLAFFIPSLYWIRDTFSGGIRFACWGIVAIYLLSRSSFKKEKHLNDEKAVISN